MWLRRSNVFCVFCFSFLSQPQLIKHKLFQERKTLFVVAKEKTETHNATNNETNKQMIRGLYHPKNANTNPDRLAEFLNRKMTGDLTEDRIPGLGPAAIGLLRNVIVVLEHEGGRLELNGITSTFGIFAVFMALKNGPDGPVGQIEHMQLFYLWWCSLGMPLQFRESTCDAIARKMNISFDGIYNPSDYDV